MTEIRNNNGLISKLGTKFKGWLGLVPSGADIANKSVNSVFLSENNGSHENFEVLRVNLTNYGFEQAGIHRGDPKALENHLSAIKEGHLTDINHSEAEQLNQQKLIENQIAELEKDRIELRSQTKNIIAVLIPGKQERIDEINQEIKKIQEEALSGNLNTGYNRSRHVLFQVLLWTLGIYLIMFYASAIHSAFFRNIIADIRSFGNRDNISMIMNSIFDPMALFTFRPSLLFIYFGSTLFFTIGLLAHIQLHYERPVYQKIMIAFLAMSIPFIVDALIAYKIHLNIVSAETLMGIKQHQVWYKNVNFWLVIAFGYVAYMAWALLYYECIREGEKRTGQRVAADRIKLLKKEVNILNNEINDLKISNNDIESRTAKIDQDIVQLKRQLEKILEDPNLLLHNLHLFFDGWLRYLNASGQFTERKAECYLLFNQFIDKHFVKPLN